MRGARIELKKMEARSVRELSFLRLLQPCPLASSFSILVPRRYRTMSPILPQRIAVIAGNGLSVLSDASPLLNE